jgi:putative tryptophan/tyrosine transport system substrate-binding protein
MQLHQLSRRNFNMLGAGLVAGLPVMARAQQPAMPVLGVLLLFSREAGKTFTDPLRAFMQALGFVEGRNIAFDFGYADGKVERLPAVATELIARRPTVIATFGDATARAAQAATSSIPIVAMSEDLVRAKLVSNLARPEANTTGVSIMGTELDAKRLELLAELLPARSTVLLLADSTTHRESRPAINSVAQAMGLTLHEAVASSADEIERALRDARQRGMAGINVLSSAFLFAQRGRIVSLAAELAMPTMYQWPETADEGGLMAYGPTLHGAFRQVVTLVAKVLQGRKPVDLPVEQPTKFALYLNLQTASTLKILIPSLTLLRADKTIE